eukprot:GDKJ01064361.1.p1 GENE.GDKJ01064361.1~~GDKJ01064361.1.p1  ORF type:complete len:642 (-),score=66.34 GDKJ01064361.1:102-2027(-)
MGDFLQVVLSVYMMKILHLVLSLSLVQSIKVLFLTWDSSHYIQIRPIIKELLRQGHSIDMTFSKTRFESNVIPYLNLNVEERNRLQLIDIEDPSRLFVGIVSEAIQTPDIVVQGFCVALLNNFHLITEYASPLIIKYYSERKDELPDLILHDNTLFGAGQFAMPGALAPPNGQPIPIVEYLISKPSGMHLTMTNDLRTQWGWHAYGADSLTGIFNLYTRFLTQKLGEFISMTISSGKINRIRLSIVANSLQKIWNYTESQVAEALPNLHRPVVYPRDEETYFPKIAMSIPEFERFGGYVHYGGYPNVFLDEEKKATNFLGEKKPWEDDLISEMEKRGQNVFLSFGSVVKLEYSWLEKIVSSLLKEMKNRNMSNFNFVFILPNGAEMIALLRQSSLQCDPAPYLSDGSPVPPCPHVLFSAGYVMQTMFISNDSVKITVNHGGASSIAEAVISHKPFIVVPCFGDQSSNGASFEHDLLVSRTVHKSFLLGEHDSVIRFLETVEHLSRPDSYNRIQRNLKQLSMTLRRQSDVQRSIDFLVGCATEFVVDADGSKRSLCANIIERDVIQGYAPDGIATFIRSVLGNKLTALLTWACLDLYLIMAIHIYLTYKIVIFVVKRVFFVMVRACAVHASVSKQIRSLKEE